MAACCKEVKVNRKHDDFNCVLGPGHSDPHKDESRGTRWNHPSRPYGCKKDPPSNGARGKTKKGHTWSAAPVQGWSNRPVA